MFRFIRTIITKIMDLRVKSSGCENAALNDVLDSNPETIETIDIDTIEMNVPALVPAPVIALVPALVPAPVIALVPADAFTYQCESTVIHKWKTSAKDDPVPLIAMIRQLYFFSECKKTTIRTYITSKDDIPNYICKIRRRPALQIDVSDADVHDHPQMFNMYRRLRTMIGMFRVNDFMVRVEHAFDNTQIESEHFAVSTIMKNATKSDMVVGCGIDPVHHIVLPLQVHLRSIYKIPVIVRTMFHHISYSIQPIVFHSHTLDTWFKHTADPPTNDQIMRLCIQMAEALTHLHALDIVHGDIKPGNTLIQTVRDSKTKSLSLYLIDFGMSGSPGQSEGTGGTKPFCAPETGNGFNLSVSMETYTWTRIQKHYDVWSFALMFFTLIALRKSTAYPKDYPSDFFDVAGYINPEYFDRIQDEPTRDLFRRALCPAEDRITAAEFLAVASTIGACD